jgi:hypothetical protein
MPLPHEVEKSNKYVVVLGQWVCERIDDLGWFRTPPCSTWAR